LMGTGNMVESNLKERTLFDQSIEIAIPRSKETEKAAEPSEAKEPMKIGPEEITPPVAPERKSETEVIQDQFFNSEKPIERLIVFFKDQTFKVYYPSK